MGVNLHPSQKRSSCEACRKHKLRCKREEPSTGRCTRCVRLNLDCVLGQQKKVGRPRRAPAEQTPSSTNTPAAQSAPPADLDMMGSSMMDFSQDFGTFDASLSVPNLDSFFMDSPSIGLGVPTRPSLIEFPFGMSSDGSLPWDATNSDPFQSASSGSSTAWTPSPSPSESTPSSTADCSFGGVSQDMLGRFLATPEHPIDMAEAMNRLSKLNLDLHMRTSVIENSRETIDFLSIVCTEGPLFIDNTSFVQFMVGTTQEFVKVLGRLRSSTRGQEPISPPPVRSYLDFGLLSPFAPPSGIEPSSLLMSGSESDAAFPPGTTSMHQQSTSQNQTLIKKEPVSLPVSLLITSIFVQLVCLFEVMLDHVGRRMAGEFGANIMPEMKAMSMGGIVLKDSCSLGIVFAELVNTLLQRSERILGTDPFAATGEPGLFTQGQKETLWRELGGVAGPSLGKVRALNVRMGLDTAKKSFLEAAMSR